MWEADYASLLNFRAEGKSSKKGKGSPYSITERRVPELIPVLGSQPAGDVSHKPGGRLPILSARPAVTLATLKRAAINFAAWWTEAVCLRLLPDSVAAAIWNPGPSAPESSTLTTRLTSHPLRGLLSISLLGGQRHDGCEQFALDCYPTASRLRFEPRPYCAWVQHELSLSCARPAADGWPLMWVSHPLQVSQLGQLSLSSFRSR